MKTVPSDIFYYDAEWIPCLRTGRLVCRLPDTATDDEVLAAMWQRAGATAEKPRPFLKLALSRVVSISAIHRHEDADGHVTFKLRSFPETADPSASEADIIVPFLEEVAAHKAQLVGFNCASADLPLFVQRGVARKCHCPTFGHRPEKPWLGDDYFSKYSESHLDLANVWMAGGRGSAVMPSLDEMAAAALVPGKLEHTGGGVLALWRTGRFAEITHYNETDACTTYLLWANTALFFGHLTPEQLAEELAQFEDWLLELSTRRPHFGHFVDVWLERRKLAVLGASAVQALPTLDKVEVLYAPASAPGQAAKAPTLRAISLRLTDFDPATLTQVRRHLKEISPHNHHLCRLGYDLDGNLAQGRKQRDRSELLTVRTLDAAGIRAAVEQAQMTSVDEWAGPEAA